MPASETKVATSARPAPSMLPDPAMQQFADEMRARPRPRRVRLSAPGAQRLCQIIKSYWNPAGFVNVQTEIVHSGGSGEAPV
jgi:hypothetical protein